MNDRDMGMVYAVLSRGVIVTGHYSTLYISRSRFFNNNGDGTTQLVRLRPACLTLPLL